MDFPVKCVATPATVTALQVAFKARLCIVAQRFPLFETETAADGTPGAPRAPVVIDGWLPPKRAAASDTAAPKDQALAGKQFPFLIVRPRSGVDSEQASDQNASAVLEIIVGTWSDTDDGFKDVVLLIDAIRSDLNQYPAIAHTAFECTSTQWAIPEEQPRPQWFGTVTTNWTLPRARRVEPRSPLEG